MNVSQQWKTQDPWTWREFTILLLLEFGLVVFVIKQGLQPLLANWLHDSLYAGTLTGVIIAAVLLGGLFVIALRPQNLSWKVVGLRRFPPRYWPQIALWFGVLTLLSIVIVLVSSLFGNTVDNNKTEALRQQVNALTLAIGILSAGIISPVYEEIFYRGFLYRWLRTRTKTGWALIISSLIFTAAHFPTLNAMPVNFLSGIVFAWTYERSGSVLPAMIIHGTFNTVAVLLTAFS